MNRNFLALLIIFSLVPAFALASCSPAAATLSTVTGNSGEGYAPDMDMAAEESARSYAGQTAPMESKADYAATDRIVIKNASLSISVENPEASMKRISEMAEELDGYVVSANLYQTYRADGVQVPTASVAIRVPAARLTEALNRIKTETTLPVRREDISSQDVTFEYTDLQSRLRNLEAAEKQLQEIMDQAKETEDVLNVYNQLVSVREQIEVIKGQIKYYDQSAALSMITVELIANAADQPIQVGGWQPEGTAREAIQTLIYAFQAFVDFLIWLVLFLLPMLLLIVLPLWLVIALLRRWRRNRRKPPAA